MASLAILIGNSAYKQQPELPCCHNDVEAMNELMIATGRFDDIHVLANVDSNALKSGVRDALAGVVSLNELFIYFSGHGFQLDQQSYLCGTDFDARRPNETGLSHAELHSLIRPASPDLVVKVVDACFSGASLIKRVDGHPGVDKAGLNNLIQISSSLQSQTSRTGDPCSQFTEDFCRAAISKSEGAIYYTDLIAALRDLYIDDQEQTPHFVTQHTGRELFVADSRSLDVFRISFETKWSIQDEDDELGGEDETEPAAELTLLAKLQAAESRFVTPEQMPRIPQRLFDGLISRVKEQEVSELFNVEVSEHDAYYEPTARGYIIRVLHKETRPDNFVTADIVRTRKKRSVFNSGYSGLSMLYQDDDFDETWDLKLNCKLPRAQLRLSLNPKYSSLQKLILVVTCAPSLNLCYVFETLTSHKRIDFDEFEVEGSDVVKNWYKQDWRHEVDWIVERVSNKLLEVVRAHVDAVSAKFS